MKDEKKYENALAADAAMDDTATAKRLMDLVEDGYIAEAGEMAEAAEAAETAVRMKAAWNRGLRWKKWAALAACLCLLVAGSMTLGQQWWNSLSHDLPLEGSVQIPDGADMHPVEGLWVPAIELPENDLEMAADMIACVVYKGGIYAHFTDGYYDEDTDKVRHLLGEKLGTAKGNLHEWSTQDAYTEEFAGSIAGDVYAVDGYGTDFRIAVAWDSGILFLERMNGIVIDTGSDIFEKRLHLTENWQRLAVLDHHTWNTAERPVTPAQVELPEETWNAFLTEINEGKFEHLWHQNPDEMEDADGRTIYDRIEWHLYVTMADGTVNQLRISSDGYVLYDGLLWYGVKISEETLQMVQEAFAH